MPSAQVLLTFFDMSARTHYVNARHTLEQAARLARGAGDQRERHHHHRRHLLRRQRLPGRPGGDPARRRPAGAAHRHRRPLHRRPRARPRRPSRSPTSPRSSSSRGWTSASRPRRSARAGCARRWWPPRWPPRPGIPAVIASRHRRRTRCAAALAGEPAGTRFHPQEGRVSSFKLWLKYAKPTQGSAHRRRRRRARAARARHQPAAGGDRRGGRATSTPGDAVEVRAAGGQRAPDRQGDRELLGRGAARGSGA